MFTKYFRFCGDAGFASTNEEVWVKITAETELKCLEIAELYENEFWSNIRDNYNDERFIDYPSEDEYDNNDEYEAAYDAAIEEYECGINVGFEDITDYVVENKPYYYSFAFSTYEVTDWSTIEWEEF